MRNNNEHDFPCDKFFKLASPHRWSCVRPFMEDVNAHSKIHVDVDHQISLCGSCGGNPYYELIIKESRHNEWIDDIALKDGWSLRLRKLARVMMSRRPESIDHVELFAFFEKKLAKDWLSYGIPIPYDLLTIEDVRKIYFACLEFQRENRHLFLRERIADVRAHLLEKPIRKDKP